MGWSAACPVPCLAVQLLLPSMLLWLPAAALPLLITRLWMRHPRRVPWAAIDIVSQAARRIGLEPGGGSLPLVLLRAAMLALVAVAAARPFLPPSALTAGRGVRIVDGVDGRRIDLVVPDGMKVSGGVSPSDGSAALRLAITALGRSGGLSGGGTSGPPTVELVRLREAGGLDASAAGDAAGGRVVTLCDGVIPRPVEAERLAALVRGGASLLVLVGPETIGSPDRGRFSDWLESLAGIGLAGAIDCEGGRIAVEGPLAEPSGDEDGDGESAAAGEPATLSGPRVERCAELTGTAAALAQTAPGGLPLIVESPVSRGRVCVSALPMSLPSARADDEFWTDLAAWPVFLPLVDRLLTHLLAIGPVDDSPRLTPAGTGFLSRGIALAPVLLAAAILLGLLDPLVSMMLGSGIRGSGFPAARIAPTGTSAGPSATTGIALARTAIIGSLIAMAMLWRERPPEAGAKPVARRPVAMLIDISPSMATADTAIDSSASSAEGGPLSGRQRLDAVLQALTAAGTQAGSRAEPPLERLCRDRPTLIATVGADMTRLGIVTPATAAGMIAGLTPAAPAPAASRQGDAIERAIADAADGLAAVVIASDGMIEAGASWGHAARFAARHGVPIVAIPVGSDGDPDGGSADVSITAVNMPQLAWRGERVAIGLRGERSSADTAPVAVALTDREGRVLAEGVLQPAPDNDAAHHSPLTMRRLSGEIVWTPTTTGTQTMLLRTGCLSASPTTAMPSTAMAGVAVEGRVVDEPIRVLVVDAVPRFEQRFLEQSLRRDPRFAVETCLLEAKPAVGMRPTAPLPAAAADWSRFDVVVLGDVSPAGPGFPEAAATGLRDAAAGDGVGIAWTPGPRSCRQAAEAAGCDWLPVLLPTGAGISRSPRRLRVVPAGLDGGWFPSATGALAGVGSGANAFGAELFDCIAPVRLRPTARILAVADEVAPPRGPSSGTGRGVPAIVLDQFGAAPILGHLCETWRWRARGGTAAYEQYWRNALVRLAQPHVLGRLTDATIEIRPLRAAEGDAVRIDVVATRRTVDRTGWRLEHDSPLTDGSTRRTILPVAGTAAHIERLEPGWHTIRLTTPTGILSREFPVAPAAVERPGRRAGSLAMEAAAVASGGEVLPLDRLATLPDTIERIERSAGVTPRRADAARGAGPPAASIRLSTNLLVIALLVGCAAEWSLRARHGLP